MGHFDHGAKRTAEGDSRAFLSMVGCLDLGENAEVRHVPREVVAGQKIADHLYEISQQGNRRVEHIESLARWKSREVNSIIERAMTVSLDSKLRSLPLRCWILLMTPADLPASLPTTFRRVRGALATTLKVRYRHLWKVPARRLIGMERPSVLPLVPLSRHGERDIRRAADLLAEAGDEDLIGQFLAHARVMYSEEELRRLTTVLEKQTLELLGETKDGKRLVRKGREQGLEEGLEQGLEQGREVGRLEGLRQAIRDLLDERFPALADADLGRFDYAEARQVFSRLLSATTDQQARKILS